MTEHKDQKQTEKKREKKRGDRDRDRYKCVQISFITYWIINRGNQG